MFPVLLNHIALLLIEPYFNDFSETNSVQAVCLRHQRIYYKVEKDKFSLALSSE